MAVNFDPNIYFQQQPLDIFGSIAKGLAFAQQMKEQKQRMGLAALESEMSKQRLALGNREADLRAQEFGLKQTMLPLEMQARQQELESAGLGFESNRLKLGQAQREIEKQKKFEEIGAQFAKGDIGRNEFNAKYFELYPEQIQPTLEKQDKLKIEQEKMENERKQWNLEYQRKLNADMTDKSWKDFQKEYQLQKPFLENQIEQEKLESSLWSKLKEKRVAGQTLTPKMVDDVSRKTASTSTLFSYLDNIQGLIKKHGTEQMPTEAKAQLQSSMRQLQGLLKSEDFINLGVLTGPDLGFLEDITGDPTSIYNVRADRILSRLNELDKGTLTKFNNDLVVNGFKPFKRDEFIKVPQDTKVGQYTVRPKGNL
jgi:hypothetical protein